MSSIACLENPLCCLLDPFAGNYDPAMRNRFYELRPVLGYLGILLLLFSGVILIPYGVGLLYGDATPLPYLVPASIYLVTGLVLWRFFRPRALTVKQSMLICILGWSLISAIGRCRSAWASEPGTWTLCSRR